MNTPLSWIKAYVPELDVTPQVYTDGMTLSGTKVEGYEKLDADLDKIVVGKILKIERHPDADKLIVCQVQISQEGDTVQIVTGAPNVKEGDVVPVVLDGGRVAGGHDGNKAPGGIKIKKGKLRGIESFGMMCSIEELGSTKEMYPDAPENGIYIFSDNPEYDGLIIGSSAVMALGLNDVVFEYEVTSNRVDCFGVLGIAREAAATFGKSFVPPVVKKTGNAEKAEDFISVEIEDRDLCSRYVARVVKNIKIGPSPLWMQRRLAACGIRPINNLVDITNYVMEEYSQPMHAYDLDLIAGKKIIVRRGKDSEEFQTLDEQVRKVDSSILMICDGEKPVGIAGIMGGENSKITEDVKTVLFEAACFDGTNIRLSGKKLGLRTDASAKFEKGLDPNTALEAMNRACQLIEELGAGEVVGGAVDIYPQVRQSRRVPFSADRTNKVLGTNLSLEAMIEYFEKVDLKYDSSTKEVIVPSFRQDVLCQADLDEEVARFFGYDNIPTTLPTGEATTGKIPFKLRIEGVARNLAEQFGFNEAMNYSFESPKVFDKLLIPEGDQLRNTVVISNPLGEDYSVMRTVSLHGMLNSLATNFKRRNNNVRLYELGNVYLPKELPITGLPEERMQFTLGMYGAGDFFDLKGVVEEFLEKIGMKKLPAYNPKAEKPYLHPGRQANIIYDNTVIGYLGEVHPEVLDNYEIREKAYIAVLDMPEILPKATFDVKYEGIAKYPAVTRDLSMLVKKEILAGEVEGVIRKNSGQILESIKLFDIYEGTQIKEGFKSMAYSVSFRTKDRTLEEKDITEVMNKILNGLSKIGIELRQ
ncbi:phenylalanine--tRNA ligase beta subunit [Anaerocolumna cellulosilytica]|uniref:Phenylalanine--tRNA ligase beta subunit n=1 Tax=Anaerocolumna cellulosilytica TaxID=433286 RepID=A0A6S6QUR9_9FIRM|nr:phenylalanine--tRNA ligase subunit beta [Anaerocolumna cellulosilytica]MBB5194501.1 phenylalanyl-tRNA synthetase beta chain [Anaerocolumna cellulosilytica]BCJ93446.1 phenylalanine--tRNA ligase beta subunit [Anaerocolumna cellulosilytica]